MKVVAARGQKCGQKFVQSRSGPAAIAQRGAPAEEENAAAAPIDIFAQEFLLQGREVIGVNRADDDAGVSKQVFGAHGKAVGEFIGIADALAIDLILTGAQHGDDLHRGIVVFGAANEFEFPARLAFDVEDAALFIADQQRARDGVVGEVLFAGERLHSEFDALCARGSGGKEQRFGLHAAVGTEGDLVFFQDLVAIANRERGLLARCSRAA